MKDQQNGVSSEEASPKIDAFHFMMNNRNRSIGGNSPGRELEDAEVDENASNKQLKARRSRLEAWADRKGAAKRKREYEEIGDTIGYKLEQRGKKMKEMLKIECQSDDEVITKRKKKCSVIETDSENSNEALPKVKKERKKRLSLRKTDEEFTPKAWKFKIKLSSDGNTDVSESGALNDCNNGNKRVLRANRAKPKSYDDYLMLDSDEENDKSKSNGKKEKRKLKVAPVFLNSVPKPKLDPQVAEARRQFLLSGVPSSVQKEMKRQQCAEEIEFDVFPAISHVLQKSSDNTFWDLPPVTLKLTTDTSTNFETPNFSRNLLNLHTEETYFTDPPTKVTNFKKIVKEIKSLNPDYPVYRIFNSIYTKTVHKIEPEKLKPTPKRRGRPKKNQLPETKEVVPTKSDENSLYAMWSDKYKPKNTGEIIGNHGAITSLKEWLGRWTNIKKRRESSSGSEFDNDGDSRDSTKAGGNTVVLKGPTGSGKTAAVYAACNELGFSVIEVNASGKRTGKRLLLELQEATQSHQVREKEGVLSSFVKQVQPISKPKMCVLLIEDVDIIFDQDEGFPAALSQIMATSKRPIVLTTTDEPSIGVQKVINDYRLIPFMPLSSILTIWLQIVCLVEGYYVKTESLAELLSYYRGDIRRTLLQLQLYVNSGGHPCQNATESVKTDIAPDDVLKMDDDNSNLSDLVKSDDCSDTNVQMHDSCLDICNVVRSYKSFSLPHCTDSGTIWWNFPTLVNSAANADLHMLFECYDAMTYVDVIRGPHQYHESLERRWRPKTRDSLVLEENMASYQDSELGYELTQTLLSGRIGLLRRKFDSQQCDLNMAVPVTSQRRWRSKQLSCEEKLLEAVTPVDYLNRKSLVLDFMPYLRTMARSECERAAHNTKRGNRFYNYLRNLGVRGSDVTYKVACDAFKSAD